MHFKKILVLLAIVAGLWVAAEMTSDDGGATDPDGNPAFDYALFEGVTRDLVTELRVENRERGVIVEMARDAVGIWSIVDPLAYPADSSVVGQLLGYVEILRGTPVVDPDLEQLGLDPATASLRVTQRAPDGTETRTEVHIGAVDVDPQRVFVRAGDRVLRAPRSILTALDREVAQYRDRSIVSFQPRKVIDFRRSGSIDLVTAGEFVDVGMEVQATGAEGGFQLLSPWRATFSPSGIYTLLAIFSRLEAATFLADHEGIEAEFGLDEPMMTIEAVTLGGGRTRVLFGPHPETADDPPAQRVWICAAEGRPHVYEIEYDQVRALATDPLDLLEIQLVSVLRDDVRALRLRSAERTLELSRPGTAWLVREGEDGGERPVRADELAADALVTLLERTQVPTHLPGVHFGDDETLGSFELETADGSVQAGHIGPRYTAEGGVTGRLFRREGDELCGLVSDEIDQLFAHDLRSLRHRSVVRFAELDTARIAITAPDGAVRERVRDPDLGTWHPDGMAQFEDRDFALLVDRLLSIRALEWLDAGQPELTDVVTVTVTSKLADAITYRLGLAETADGPQEQIDHEGERAAVSAGLRTDLLALFDD